MSEQTTLINLNIVHHLIQEFNWNKGKVRQVALVSPTCPGCIAGFQAVRNILERIDHPQLTLQIVWQSMLFSDNKKQASAMAKTISDERVVQYWDENNISAKFWQEPLEICGPVWDVYLLYNKKAEWQSKATKPDYWMHQLCGVNQAPCLDENVLEKELTKLLKL